MCRAGGRRCPGQHGPEAKARAAARAKERYKQKKLANGEAYKPHNTEPPVPGTENAPALTQNTKLVDILNAKETYAKLVDSGDTPLIKSVKTLGEATAHTSLASSPVDKELPFDSYSSNMVKRLLLEDGTVGYWKGLAENEFESDAGEVYQQTTLSSMRNEAAAYKLAEALQCTDLVPETVIREYNGELGSFQKGLEGDCLSVHNMNNLGKKQSVFSNEDLRKAALFDYIAGSQDRHTENIIVVTDENGNKRPGLIDNGYSFSDSNEYLINATYFTGAINGSIKNDSLNQEEREQLTKLQESGDLGGMKAYLTPPAYKAMSERIEALLNGSTISTYEETYMDPEFDIDEWF